MDLSEALKFAEECKKNGNISTSAKAVIALAEAYGKERDRFANLDRWLSAKPGWYVHDYADGWIFHDNESDARILAADMGGAAIREVKDGVCRLVG